MQETVPISTAFFHIMSGNFSGAAKNIFRLVRLIDPATLQVILVGQAENELTSRVRDLGLKVAIVPYPSALDVYDRQLMNLSIRRLFEIAGGMWHYTAAVAKLLRDSKVQVVWADNIRTLVLIYVASKLSGCRVIWNIWSEPEGKLAWVLHRLGLVLADVINLEYENQGPKLFGRLARSGPFRRKFVTLYTGVTDFEELSGNNIREELHLGSDDVLLLMASNISPAKGQLDLLHAMGTLLETFPNLHLLIAGRASEMHPASVVYDERLRQHVIAHDLARNVHFLGWRSDAADLFQATDIYVSTSYSESFPDAVREAMRAAKPVVVTDVGGTGELVGHGKTGLLFKPGDVPALVRDLSHLIRDGDERRSMGNEGGAVIRQRFSTEAYARRFEAMVLNVRTS